MSSKVYFSFFILVAFLAKSVVAQDVFDVTKYGAVGDGKTNDTKAFLAAWEASCSYNGNSTFMVPSKTFLVGHMELIGPCPNNTRTNVLIKGELKAPTEHDDYSKKEWIGINQVDNLNLGGGGSLDGQGAYAWPLKKSCPKKKDCVDLPTSLIFNNVKNALISNLHFKNSKGVHINFHQSSDIQVSHLNISAPGDSPNTDGIHIAGTNNIRITDSKIGTGDDCISVGPGARNLHISKVFCGPGHGISIGSLGKYKNEKDVVGVKVRNCTLTGTTNGVRVKSWPGAPPSKAMNITFEDITLNNVTNPIIIDQHYCPDNDPCASKPSGVSISNVTFKRIRGTSNSPVAVRLMCSDEVPCKNVKLQDIDIVSVNGNQITSQCANVKASFSGAQEPAPCN